MPGTVVYTLGEGTEMTQTTETVSTGQHIARHFMWECRNEAQHYADAETIAIPKCLENRLSQIPDGHTNLTALDAMYLYCVSAYCPRCTEIRRALGKEPLVPNEWMHKVPVVDQEQEDADQLAELEVAERMWAIGLVVNMHVSHFAPDMHTDAGEQEMSDMLALAHAIGERRTAIEIEDDANPADIRAAFEMASRMTYPSRERMTSSFTRIAHMIVHYIAGDISFIRADENPENNGGF